MNHMCEPQIVITQGKCPFIRKRTQLFSEFTTENVLGRETHLFNGYISYDSPSGMG